MRAGKLDRRITIERATYETNDFGEEVEIWECVATVWAQQRPVRGAERFTAQEFAGTRTLTFHIRYTPSLTVRDRIRFKNHGEAAERTYNIVDVREIGRGVVTEFDAVARSD